VERSDEGSARREDQPGSARQEAERLVATALAAASLAARRLGGTGWAGGGWAGGRWPGPQRGRQAYATRDDEAAAGDEGAERASGAAGGADSLNDLVGHLAAAAQAVAGQLAGARPAAGRTWSGWYERGSVFATGDPECCVCPICRVIAAMRDPRPEVAERLATGAGDFAAGLASLLRSLGSVAGGVPGAARRRGAGQPGTGGDRPESRAGNGSSPGAAGGWPAAGSADEVWHAATRAPGEAPGQAPGRAPGEAPPPRKPMAKKAVKRPAEPRP